MRRELGHVLVLLAVVPVSIGATWAPSGEHLHEQRSLTFEDRVAAQRAIEEVYWRHRIWPKENPTPKSSLDAVMPESAIRVKVEDYLRKSNALEEWWQRPITGEQLQAELDRMARDTRDPRILQELFDALGDDAFLIAETLARQTLVERLIRSWYASDDRFHGETRRSAERALAACASVECLKSIGGAYHKTVLKLRSGDEDRTSEEQRGAEVRLSAEEWKKHLDLLAAAFGATPESLPARRVSALQETPDGFAVTAVLRQEKTEMVTTTTFWPKRTFDAWWKEEVAKAELRIEAPAVSYVLPAPVSSGCENDTWTPTRIDVPDARHDHSAVWTGTEMIIWGGSGTNGPLDTGGRYDPSTDTWVATSTGANLPAPREGHSAVWTGTEMIVWGGLGVARRLNTGGRYDPSTNTWTPTSTGANVPAPRQLQVAIWTGAEMIIWGGCCPSRNTGGRYNPSTDTWLPTSTGANVPVGGSPLAVWTGTDMILWAYGVAARYNPSTDRWTPISTSNAPANAGSAVWTGTEMIVWGGQSRTGGRYDPTSDLWRPISTVNSPASRGSFLSVWTGTEMIIWGTDTITGGRYNPSTDTWTSMSTGANVPPTSYYYTVVWTGSEMIVWGGGQNIDASIGGRYNPSTDSWVPISMGGKAPLARENHTAVWTGAEMIVWGGDYYLYSNRHYLNSGGRYSPSTDSWIPTSVGEDVPTPRVRHTAVWTGARMIIWGGGTTSNTNTGGLYDPATDRWTAISIDSNVPSPRAFHTAVWTGKEMIVWGGGNLNTGGRYDPSTDRWTATSTGTSVPSPRGFHTAVWTGREMIIWGGGFNLNTGGRYDPKDDRWTPTSTGANVPDGRYQHGAVWTGKQMIVWGGDVTGHSELNTGGLYDPSTDRWTPTSTDTNVPTSRSYHGIIWTGSEMIVWGGLTGASPLNTGGRYDPKDDRWTPTSTGANVPSGRYSFSSVWTGTEMIVWGGLATSTGGSYCACPGGRLVYFDGDADGFGSASESAPSCDGSVPAGYVADGTDCDDSDPNVHPGAVEVCNGIDDNCNGQVDEDPNGEDSDGDEIHNLCDNCPFDYNPSQADTDHNGKGDVCDLNDGLIWEWRNDRASVMWQAEQGPTSWNVYIGDLDVLKGSGVYTQVPGSNALADRHCGETSTFASEKGMPAVGKVSFSLVTGVTNGVEGSLGSSSEGPRPNANPCP